MRRGGDTGTRDVELAAVGDTSSHTEGSRDGDGTAQGAPLKSGKSEPETLAAAEQDEWGGLIDWACQKHQEEEERKHVYSNQLEDKEHAHLRRASRAIFKANNGCLRAAKQIMVGSKQATPGEETTKMIRAQPPRVDFPEAEWARTNEGIEECKKLTWKV